MVNKLNSHGGLWAIRQKQKKERFNDVAILIATDSKFALNKDPGFRTGINSE
mgnify:CR=1 FL=1